MRKNRLLGLINRAQHDLNEARREVQLEGEGEDEELDDDLLKVRLRLDALEIRVSAIEEGQS